MSGAQRWAVVLTVVVLLGGFYMARGTVAWLDRGCNLSSAVVHSVIRGEPGTFEYCVDRRAEPTVDTPGWEPPETAPPTTLDPTVVAEQERLEAEARAVEEERQARIDACWAAHDAEWTAWEDAYNAWLDETDGQGNYDAWLADHPEPVTPDC